MKRWFAAAAVILSSNVAHASFGRGTTYNQVEGDIVASPALGAFSTGLAFSNGVVTITGGTGNDVASVTNGTVRGTVVAKRGSFTATYSGVDKIIFYGNDGDDTFTNGTSIPCEVYGNDGNDVLYGGGGADFLVGGYGQDTLRGYGGDDTIWGSGGSDWLYGGDGDDLVKGHGGNDQIYGENGEDALYGGSGDDTLSGGANQDTLVSIGGGFDTLYGGTSNDLFWMDTSDFASDATATENADAWVNKVSAFYPVSYNGGAMSITIPKDLTSFDLPDPVATNANVDLVNYADHPLFPSVGPNKEDVLQGTGNDCYVLGPLAAVADATPDSIKKLVVDLDDGTYAVRLFHTAGSPDYVRVDADLWVDDVSGVLEYAHQSLVEGAIWGPIVEKAWAIYRRYDAAYASISGGNGSGSGTVGMGADTSDGYEIDPIFDADDVIAWDAAGRPSGWWIKGYIDSTVPQLLNWIADRQDAGLPVYTGNISGASNSTAFVVDNWRRGQHIIMVDHVNFDANGNPVSLTLRDQYGPVYRTITDFARIYFLIGRAYVYDMP